MHALIEPGATHSYVCIEREFDKMTAVEQLSYDIHVTSPLRHSVNVNRVYKNFPIIIHDREFSTDLILGMDWLSKHRAKTDCDKKIVALIDSCHGRVSGINKICFLYSSYCRSQATAA